MWIIKIQCVYPHRILNEHWCIYSCLKIPPRDNWFQYMRRVYATEINFPCIITLVWNIFYLGWSFNWKLIFHNMQILFDIVCKKNNTWHICIIHSRLRIYNMILFNFYAMNDLVKMIQYFESIIHISNIEFEWYFILIRWWD